MDPLPLVQVFLDKQRAGRLCLSYAEDIINKEQSDYILKTIVK